MACRGGLAWCGVALGRGLGGPSGRSRRYSGAMTTGSETELAGSRVGAEESTGWIEALAELKRASRPCVMVVVTGSRGSTPRGSGTRMLVAGEGPVWGTIGGGNLEHLALERARGWLTEGRIGSETVVLPLSASVGQCCGGEVTLYFEAFAWQRARVVIFGAGHVGQALAGLTPYLAAEVLLIDERAEEELHPAPPVERPWRLLCIDEPQEEVAGLEPGAALLIMTHSHARDLAILEAALRRDDFAYVGLIGSERKWQRFRARLCERGFGAGQLARVTCPIGEGVTSKEPNAIALAAAAQVRACLAAVQA
ncbi:MAG: xanthine dehydrogenase accessory protein XdhC [Planctomycetes bacterium]|nr:xanthine dehydrogenase accessory protein XdhC [Planctomycetota bacterium]